MHAFKSISSWSRTLQAGQKLAIVAARSLGVVVHQAIVAARSLGVVVHQGFVLIPLLLIVM